MAKFVNEINIRFMMNEVFDVNGLTQYPYYAEHNEKVLQMVVDAALKLAEKELHPLLREMDQKPPIFENGRVNVHPMVKKLMKAYGEGGWISAGFSESHDGDQLPVCITAIYRFIFAAANYSASVYPELSAGAAQLITTFGSKALIDTYVPSMLEGKWQGTMALTEPQAGSSLSDITTTAFPISPAMPDDTLSKAGIHSGNVYKIKGQKTFISAGDHDGVENIIHLMLARIEGAPPGVKGISLFVVPKKRLRKSISEFGLESKSGSEFAPISESKSESGPTSEKLTGDLILNDVKTAGIYHKLGYRGAPITELSMGDNDDCFGWLVGEPGRGLIQMFQMMNEARLGVGLGATAIASAAYHAALDYASNRPQGRAVDGKDPLSPQVPIINHADVKRMLLFQKAVVEGAFSLILQCCRYADLEKVTAGEEKEKYALLLDLLTPVAKSWPSEQGIHAVSHALQCFGGYGYCDDFPIEQYFRDARIHPIHEGTTGIQGMDLLGRKLMMENGKAALLFMAELQNAIYKADQLCQKAEEKKGFNGNVLAFPVEKLTEAMHLLEKTGNTLFSAAQKKGVACFLADATLFLEFFGITAIAWQWLLQGTKAVEALSRLETEAPEPKRSLSKPPRKTEKERCFYEGKLYTMNYFFRYELPKINALAARLTDGDDLTVTMPEEYFA